MLYAIAILIWTYWACLGWMNPFLLMLKQQWWRS